MLFRKKKSLKSTYDHSLLQTMQQLKEEWKHQERLEELTKEDTEAAYMERQLSKAKYFYLFKEAKVRQVKASPQSFD